MRRLASAGHLTRTNGLVEQLIQRVQEELLAVAVEAADAAGALLLERFGSARQLATKSSPTDVVTEADLAAEREVRAVLQRRRPDDGVLGEEGTGDTPGTTGLRWVVDPIDGTVNFLYGHPQWCVSVAVEDDRGSLAGVVLDAVRGERFTATRDGAARLGDRELRPAAPEALASTLVGTGFGYDAEVRRAQAGIVAAALPVVRDIRRAGSAALDLAWCAAGRLDAYWERGTKPWDVAAGGLLCERAGREVRAIPAAGVLPEGFFAAPPPVADELWALVSSAG